LSEIQLEVTVDVQEAEVVAAPLQTPKKSLMSVPMKSSSEQSSMFFRGFEGLSIGNVEKSDLMLKFSKNL
jgi:hypothetical protein